jgi:DNA-binding SARP family transcriptional activator
VAASGSIDATRVMFAVLGPLELPGAASDSQPCGKPATLLALLLLHANAWVGADAISDALWPSAPPASADRNIKTYVWQLRRVLPPAADETSRLQGRRGGYRILVAPDELDATVLEAVAGWSAPEPDAVLAALSLWRGRPFAEVPEELSRLAVARLEQLRWRLREQLADALGAAQRFAEVVALVRPLICEDPLREELWTRLVHALTSSGRRAEALSAYHQARRALVDELGVEPGPELREAQRRALAGEPAGGVATGSPSGLRLPLAPSYLPRAVEDFTGRQAETRALRAARDGGKGIARIAVVEGMPGVGKTALAVQVAHELAARYPDGQVFCDLHGHDPLEPPADPADVLFGLLSAFGVPAGSIPAGVDQRAGLWRSMLSDRRVLLVLDDAVGAAQVAPLLPGTCGAFTIVTSRRRLCGLDGVRNLELDPLPDADALDLLAGPQPHGDAGLLVARLCGNLPLALRVATGRLRQRPSWDASRLATRLRCPGTRLAELRTGDHDLAAMFTTSYERLSVDGQRVFRVLTTAEGRRCSPCLSSRALPGADPVSDLTGREIATLVELTADRVERALDELLEHHLATQCPGGRYTAHVLLRAYGHALIADPSRHGFDRSLAARVVRTA